VSLPPGPSFAALQTARYALAPYAFYRRLTRRYGDVFTVPTLLGPIVIATHPAGVRAIFTAPGADVARWGTEAASPLVGDHSLILTHGEPHRRARKLLMPPFHGARMNAYFQVTREAALRVAGAWPRGPFRLLDATLAISLEVAMRAVFGVDDPGRVRRLEQAILASHDALTPTIMLFKALRHDFGGRGPWARFLRRRGALDALVHEEIAARRTSGGHGEDILSSMLEARYDDGAGMSDAEIRDQLVTLIFAAHETTGVALAWSFYWLAGAPDVRARLEAELRALGDDPPADRVAAAPLLDAVCQETLRLHPVIPEVIRRLLAPLEVQGFTVPAGTAVAACTTIVHERPEVFAEPHVFRPERFLGKTYSPFEYFPFGGGSRRCIGAAFALHQMKAVVASLVPRYRVEVVHPQRARPVLRNLTVGPRDGIVVVAQRQ
jgi:cytochrome P450